MKWPYISPVVETTVIYTLLVCSCMGCFQKLKREHAILRQKLESYFQVTFKHCRVMTIDHPFPVPPRVLMFGLPRSCCDKLVLLEQPLDLSCKYWRRSNYGESTLEIGSQPLQ
jgi:hypothetical protein